MDIEKLRKKPGEGKLLTFKPTEEEREFLVKHQISFSALVHESIAELRRKAKK